MLESMSSRQLAQRLPDYLDLIWPQHTPCARQLPIRYVVPAHARAPPKATPAQQSTAASADLVSCICSHPSSSRSMPSGCPLLYQMGRLQSSLGGHVCSYRAGNHYPSAWYRACSTRVRLRSSCVFAMGGSIKTSRFGRACRRRWPK